MPLYEYECDVCGHRFEKIRKFSDPPIEVCPDCGGAVRKLIASPAFHLKGSGWYITDYAKKDSVPGGKTGGSKDEGSSEASDAKAEKSEKSGKDAKEGKDGSATAKETSTKSDATPSTSSSTAAPSSAPPKATKPEH